MSRSSAALLALAAVAGLAVPIPGGPVSTVRGSHNACPKCSRGKLQGKSGSRYCHRCSWFESGEQETVDRLVEKFGGEP